MTNEDKLAVLNSMQIIETDSDGETLFYVLVDYNEENLDKLEQVVPDVEKYLADYGDEDGDKTAIEISNAAWEHAGATWFDGEKFLIQLDLDAKSKLKVKKSKYKAIDEDGTTRFVTQYTNGFYTLFVNEFDDKTIVNVAKANINYPSIMGRGINIGPTGTLTLSELEEHVELLEIAKATYKQIFNMFENVRIN